MPLWFSFQIIGFSSTKDDIGSINSVYCAIWCHNIYIYILYIYIYCIYIYTYLFLCTPSRQILVLRTSRGRLPPTSPGRPLKILFDRPGDVPIWRLGDVLKRRPEDVLIWRSRDVPRTFSGRPLEDLQGTQTWMSPIFFLTFVSELIRLTKSI